MSGRTGRTLAALERAFLSLDRGLGGANPPPAPQAFAARHPAGCATVVGLLVAIAVGLDFATLWAVLVGTCAWLLFDGACAATMVCSGLRSIAYSR